MTSGNQRTSERHPCYTVAKLKSGARFAQDCVITDTSDGGIRAIAESSDIPTQFTIIPAVGRPRDCRLAWQIGCEFGAQFLS
jgi:hypothetical protein